VKNGNMVSILQTQSSKICKLSKEYLFRCLGFI